MNITSHTFLVYKTTVLSTVFQFIQRNYRHPRNRAGFSHVYFISLASFRILKKMKIHLPCHLLPLHRSNDGKKSQSRQLADLSLHSFRIVNLKSHQLISPPNSHYSHPFPMRTQDSLRHPVPSQLIQVIQSAFAARKQNNISFGQIFRIISIIKVHSCIPFQSVEICKV